MQAEKALLRSTVRSRIKALSDAYIASSDRQITQQLLALPAYDKAECLFAYWSVGREVDTHRLILTALASGKQVALPMVFGDGQMAFGLIGNAQELVQSEHIKIPEPPGDSPRAEPTEKDLILVPALCYDSFGYRLGHGGGYYDRFLSGRKSVTVGLAREQLLMDKLPREAHDLPVQYLVTENRISGLL